jgi:signal peptidase I
MEPTIAVGEIIKVDLNAYNSVIPSRWDVVVFKDPIRSESSEMWCSRIVGLPDEVITIEASGMLIDGKNIKIPSGLKIGQYKEPVSLPNENIKKVKFPYEIPENCYFVLGDNVDNALDSRYWGAIPIELIIGKVPDK